MTFVSKMNECGSLVMGDYYHLMDYILTLILRGNSLIVLNEKWNYFAGKKDLVTLISVLNMFLISALFLPSFEGPAEIIQLFKENKETVKIG